MPKHLYDMDIKAVALVDKAANGKKFHIIKRLNDDEIKKANSSDIANTNNTTVTSFKETIKTRDAKNKFYDAFWTLHDIADNILRDYEIKNKTELLGQSIDEFKDYILDLTPQITKRDLNDVTKSGRTLSAKNLSKIKNAIEVLTDLIDGIESNKGGQNMSKNTVETSKRDERDEKEDTTNKVSKNDEKENITLESLSKKFNSLVEEIKKKDEVIQKQAEEIKKLNDFKDDVLKNAFSSQEANIEASGKQEDDEFSSFNPVK